MASNVNIVLQLMAVDRLSQTVRTALGNAESSLSAFEKRTKHSSLFAFQQGRDFADMGRSLAGAIKYPVQEAVDFETSMLGVAKQVDGARDAGGKLTKVYYAMRREILDLGTKIPVVNTELARMAEEGAKSGVASNELMKFVENNAKMSTALEMSGQETAMAMGKLANIWQMSTDETMKYADAINYLDDRMQAVHGPDLMEILRRTSAVARMTRMTKNETAALAATYLSLGRTPEVAATGMNALMGMLQAPPKNKGFAEGLSQLGLSHAGLAKGMATAPMATLHDLLTRIAALPAEKQTAMNIKLFGREYFDDVAVLTGNLGQLDTALRLVGSDIDVNARKTMYLGSVMREFTAKLDSAGAKFGLLRGQASKVVIEFGTALLPVLIKLMEVVTPFLAKLSTWIQENPKLASTLGTVIIALSAISFAVSALSFAFGGVIKLAGGLATGFRFLVGIGKPLGNLIFVLQYRWLQFTGFAIRGLVMLRNAFLAFTMFLEMNPIVLTITAIVAAIALLAYGAYLIYENWGGIKKFFSDIWTSFSAYASNAWEGIKFFFGQFGDTFTNAGKNIMMSIADGMLAGMLFPLKAMAALAEKLRAYLPFSPAKTGALRDIHRIKLVETIASAIRPGPALAAMDTVTSQIATRGGGGYSPSAPSINYSPVITINGGGESAYAEFARMLREHSHEVARIVADSNRLSERRAF